MNGYRYRYVHVITDRHGKARIYFPSPHDGSHVRLPNNLASAVFRQAYDAALAGVPIPWPRKQRAKVQPRPTRTPLTGVYLLLLDGEVVYVGSSRNMPNRIIEHRRNGRPFDQMFYIGTNEGERLALEKLLIRAIRPRQNRNGYGL